MTMVFKCRLVSCLLVTELFAGIHFRGKGGGQGIEDD